MEEKKVTEYLLNLQHREGGPKARFFIARGFAPAEWTVLQRSLVIQGQTNPPTRRGGDTIWGALHGRVQLSDARWPEPLRQDGVGNRCRRTADAAHCGPIAIVSCVPRIIWRSPDQGSPGGLVCFTGRRLRHGPLPLAPSRKGRGDASRPLPFIHPRWSPMCVARSSLPRRWGLRARPPDCRAC